MQLEVPPNKVSRLQLTTLSGIRSAHADLLLVFKFGHCLVAISFSSVGERSRSKFMRSKPRDGVENLSADLLRIPFRKFTSVLSVEVWNIATGGVSTLETRITAGLSPVSIASSASDVL